MIELAELLRGATRIALGLAVLTLVLPGAAGSAAGWGMVAVLVGAPLVRVGYLGLGWRDGDPRYARLAAGLLVVVAAGAALAGVLR